MHLKGSRCIPSNGSHCSCSNCTTSFCVVKSNDNNHCKKCKEFETSVYYYGEESRINNNISKENNPDTSDRVNKRGMDVDTIESRFCPKKNATVADENAKDVNIPENDKGVAETRSVDTDNSGKVVSNTTAQLSAQIMNLSYKDYKESVSVERTRPPHKIISNPNDIFRKIKEAYDACTCKICECLIGKSIPSPNKPCDCEPCNCKDCTRYRRGLTNLAIDPRVIPRMELERKEKTVVSQSKKCNCKPCDCVQCIDSSPEPCSCKPCECVECKSMVIHRTKTIIVAPVEEGNQRANCLCAPCDCARCTHRGLNLSPNRMHEMSTGINRHPNCHCETCINESCEPNGTDSCRCETHRGIMSKPFDSDTRDFDIHRTAVSNNPLSSRTKKLKMNQPIPINLVEDNIYFPLQSSRPSNQQCSCSVCECIVCQCKDTVSTNLKTSKTYIKGLKTLKLPGVIAEFCKCSPCECQYCSDGQQTCFRELKSKSCSCQVCDCLYCEGALEQKNTVTRMIPVLDTRCREKCECKCNSLQITLSRINGGINCIDENNASDEVLYPTTTDAFLRPSMLRNDPVSEPELLKKSSEYTHIKHSKGQSNVFKNEASTHTISKQNLTIFHVIPKNKYDPSFYKSTTPFHGVKNQNKSDLIGTKDKDVKRYESFDESNSGKALIEFYSASTSKTSSSDTKLETLDRQRIRNNVLESVITACLKDSMGPSTFYKSHTPSLSSIPLSTHNLLNLSNSSLAYTTKSHQLSIFSPDGKVNRASAPLHIDSKSIINITEAYSYDKMRSIPKDNVKQCECNICQYCGSCDEQDTETNINTSKIRANEVTQTLQFVTSYKEDDDGFSCNRFATYFSSNLTDGKSDLAVVRNRSKTPFFNRKTNDKQNTSCAWRLTNGNLRAYSANTINLLFPKKSAPYERALITLQKAKEFSLELRQLLEKYEKANLEFESVSKKLKESHETIFDSLKHDIGDKLQEKNGFVNICNGRALSDNYIYQNCDFRDKDNDLTPLNKKSYKNNHSMPLIVEDIKKTIHSKENYCEKFGFINDITGNKTIGTITTNSLRSVCVNYNEMFKSKSCEEIINKFCQFVNKSNENLNNDLSYLKDGEVIIGKESDDIEVIGNYYNIYRKLIKRTAHIRTMNGKNSSPTDSETDIEIMKTLDCDTLKKLIKQEMKVLIKQLGEIERNSKSRSAFGENTKVCNVLAVTEELKAKHLKATGTLADITTETKFTMMDAVDSKLKMEVKDAVKATSTQNHLETPLKELLRGLTDSLPAAPAAYSVDEESTVRVKKSKSGYDEMKVGFLGVRRVSDHTVTIKWEKPKIVKDVQGYEILVDGLPVQKILNPARCMAVITCLPHSERVLLSIRTIAKKLSKSGPHPCATIVYQPRAK